MEERCLLLLVFLFLCLIGFDADAQNTPPAPLQDRMGTPIHLTPLVETPSPTITPGPAPTPMKIAG